MAPAELGSGNLGPKGNPVEHVLSKALPLFDSLKDQNKGKREFGMKFIFKVGPAPQLPVLCPLLTDSTPQRGPCGPGKAVSKKEETFEVTRRRDEGSARAQAQSCPREVSQK